MRRNPELAHQVSLLPDVQEARHTAIDKITSAHLVVDLLSRATAREVSAIEELELEERVEELIVEAVYHFIKYRRFKQNKYDHLLHEEALAKDKTISDGNDLIKQHKADLDYLSKERGIQ